LSDEEDETMFIKKLIRKQEVVDPIEKGKAKERKVEKNDQVTTWMESG
jgi:hypothetical protein